MDTKTAPPEIEATEMVGQHFEETRARIRRKRKEVAAARESRLACPKPTVPVAGHPIR